MHVVCTHIDSTGTAWLTIRQTRGPVDLLAHLAVELGCNEDATGSGFCLINPPTWMFRIGGHHKYSLGGASWHLGQWAFGRLEEIPEVHRHEVTRAELEAHFDWIPCAG